MWDGNGKGFILVPQVDIVKTIFDHAENIKNGGTPVNIKEVRHPVH